MREFLITLFGYPAGIVLGNLIASFLIWLTCTVPLIMYHHRKLKKHVDKATR